MLLVPEAQVYRILTSLSRLDCVQFLDALTAALVLYSTENTSKPPQKLLHQPPRSSIVTTNGTTSLFMPCSDTRTNAIKIITLPSQGDTVGVNVLFAPSGQILGLVGASHITAFRTALATMCLFARVTHIPKRHIVVFGSGKQVEWHIRLALLLAGAEIEKITIVNRGWRRLQQLDETVLSTVRQTYANVRFTLIAQEDDPGYNILLETELASADAVLCCTPSKAPLFVFRALQTAPKPRFISLIGSYKPNMKEVDTETLLSGGGKVFVDSKEACLAESGELIGAGVSADQLIELGEHFRRNDGSYPKGNIILKCVGMGIMDLVASRLLLEKAKESGQIIEVEEF
ncbi:hypothetical protein BJX63DRAFT_409891 [Aspergillus granulosus]|uniref:Uncharacterized protein n=1 Tax=Aspergillus granulosus TaxID=176169 RepID=A0ABR4GYZ4_9EURO